MLNLLLILIVGAILLLTIFLIYRYSSKPSTPTNSIGVRSPVTSKPYQVQDLPNSQEAANMLGTIDQRIETLRAYLEQNINQYPHFRPYIQQFLTRIRGVRLVENPPDGKYTSFTVNKGEEIALCLRSIDTGDLHDINLVMYVVLHELAHVACPEIDHTPLFKEIFVFFLNVAIKLGIYTKVNYKAKPQKYCGLTINENLLG